MPTPKKSKPSKTTDKATIKAKKVSKKATPEKGVSKKSGAEQAAKINTKSVLGKITSSTQSNTDIVKEIKIGKQFWMANNLDVTEFRNGDPIFEAKTAEEWEQADENGQPAWCYFNNDAGVGAKYGKLYNWYAVKDSRGLAPMGWHVPSDEEWQSLEKFIGGEGVAGKKLKSTGEWKEKGNGLDEVGFRALPGGNRGASGTFYEFGSQGGWWSSSEASSQDAWVHLMKYDDDGWTHMYFAKGRGFSVRCTKD